jgi:hypothetical protein
MLFDTCVQIALYLPVMEGMTAAGVKVYNFLLLIFRNCGLNNGEKIPLNVVKMQKLLRMPMVQLAKSLQNLESCGLITMEGKGEKKTLCLRLPSDEVIAEISKSPVLVKGWREEAVEKPARTTTAPILATTIHIIDFWNQELGRPKTSPPEPTLVPGTYNCLATHIKIDKLLQKIEEDGFPPEAVKDAIVQYKLDPAPSEKVRKLFPLAGFLENKFARGLPESLCREYLKGRSPFKSKKVELPPRPELEAPGLFNSLKLKFAMAFCGGSLEGIDELREIRLIVAANKISAAIKKWAPQLKRKLQSSEWAEYILLCVDEKIKYNYSKNKRNFDPFYTITQNWFVNQSLPLFLSRPPACVLESYQVQPINPEEGRQVAAG